MNAPISSRRDFLKATGLGAVSLALPSWSNAGQTNAALWQVGYAEADITPQPGQCMMAGYGRERYAGGTWTARQYLALPIEKESFRYDVQLWRFGRQLTIFGMEGEICSPWGPMLRSMARTEHSMVIGYANNTSAYIPDKRIVREGGYEGFSSHRVYFQPGPFTQAINQEVKAIVARALDATGARPQS